MKVRKLAVALALAGGLGSGVAQALGLGEIELQSYLNEPMDAQIVLPQSRGVDPGDVFVNIAPDRAYQRLGLQRSQFVGKLRFEVVTGRDGRLMVNVSSREPLREPYLNFLLELTWPNGRLMREYAVLVDPPVYAEESGVDQQVQPASGGATQSSPSAASARNAESARRQARVQSAPSGGYQGETFGPTSASDTLWTIASAVRPEAGLSTQQVMLALQDLNPDAFIGNNINRLKRGQVLRIPTADQVRQRSRAEATRAVAQQNEAFQQPQRTVDATTAPQSSGSGGAEQAQAGGDELKLLVADNEGNRSEAEGGSAGGDSQLAGGVDAGAAVAMEELESARRENDELNSRVDDLQDQVETLQRLLELKNTQLAEMQQGAIDGEAAADSEAAPQTAPGEGGAEDPVAEAEDTAATDSAPTGTAGADTGPSDQAELADNANGESADANQGSVADPVGGVAGAEQENTVTAGDEPFAAGEGSEPSAAQTPEATTSKPQTAPVADKGFPGNVIDAIIGNTLYQIALGGGLVLLLLILLLVARRNANREKSFYEELNSETDGPDDTFDLSLDDEEEPAPGGNGDPLAEADAYLAYGRYDQAAQTLETAISREPSRTDLRLKLLGVYADNQDRASFEKQYGEIRTLDDDEAVAQASALRTRLEEAETRPSIDDLEPQLRSGSYSEDSRGTETGDHPATEADSAVPEDTGEEDTFADFDTDFSDLDLDALDADGTGSEEQPDAIAGESEPSEDAEQDSRDDLIEYDLSELELPQSDEAPETDTPADEDDFSSLGLDLEEPVDAPEDTAGISEQDEVADDATLESLDESFLDDLDAELDKVASEEDELGGAEMEESTLDDLELDLSDEDLALMEEFSDSADTSDTASGGDDLPRDRELSLEDELSLDDELEPDEVLGDEELASIDAQAEALDDALQNEELPVASDEVRDQSTTRLADIDEDDLGDEDDFDFLAGTDEAATKLDLARAYVEMGDQDGARGILEEVALEGDDEQKTEAQDLLKNLS